MTESAQLELFAGERRLVHRRNGIVIRHEKTRTYNGHDHYQGTVLDIGRTTFYLGQWYGDEAKWWMPLNTGGPLSRAVQ